MRTDILAEYTPSCDIFWNYGGIFSGTHTPQVSPAEYTPHKCVYSASRGVHIDFFRNVLVFLL